MKSKNFVAIILCLFAVMLVNIAVADTYIVAGNNTKSPLKLSGVVKNKVGKPLPYIYVYIQGNTAIKTTTELDGKFVLIIPDSVKLPFKLEFYCVQYKKQTYIVTTKSKSKAINIKLISEEPPKSIANEAKIGSNKKNAKYKLSEEITTLDLPTDSPEATTLKIRASAEISAPPENSIEGEVMPLSDVRILPAIDATAGKLTAGELNDFAKWTLWEDIATGTLEEYQKEWRVFPNERYVAQLTNPDGMPIVDAIVCLKDRQGNTLWQARTDNTGKAELWATMLDDSLPNAGKPYKLDFLYDKQTAQVEAFPFAEKINSVKMPIKCSTTNSVDINFIVDATGSMGDEIRYLQAELYDVIEKIQSQNKHIKLRTGSVFYRDKTDEYLTRTSPFDTNSNTTIAFIKQQNAGGGGDTPEAVDDALIEAIENMDWQKSALARIAFIILDAPPHSDKISIEKMQRQVRLAAMKGIRLVPLVCSGADKSTEYLMRAIALATNGTYVFLTDESGIGEPHIKPTTDKYEVEKLNHILFRIITEFSHIPNCNNNLEYFDKEVNSLEKFAPKPYKENPDDSTERLELTDILTIYPNPTNGELNIQLLKTIPDLYLADITGKVLQNFSFDNPRTIQIILNDYSTGIYFINAFYQGRWYTAKFLLNG